MPTVHGAVAFDPALDFAVAGHKITHGTISFDPALAFAVAGHVTAHGAVSLALSVTFSVRGRSFSLIPTTAAALTLTPAASSTLSFG